MPSDVTTSTAVLRPGTARVLRGRTAPRVAAVVVAVLAAVAVWAVWQYFVDTAAGQQLDRIAYEGAVYGKGKLWRLAEPVLDVVSVSFVVLGLGVAMGIALIRRRWWLAVQVAVLVGGANLTTQILKYGVLGRDNLIGGRDWPNTLPSGHTTVAATVSAALLLVVPRAWRPAVAVLGGAYTAATGVSTLIGQWHRPSDVVAALCVVLAWTAVVCALTPDSARDESDRAPGTGLVAVLLLVGAAVAGAVSAAAAARVSPATWATGDAAKVTAYVGGAFGVVAVTAAAFAVVLLLRQATARPVP